jgi:glutathione S-transferase
MLKLHHLSNARSQKTLWLLEELGVPYELQNYERGEDLRAPTEFKALHPLATAPLLEVRGSRYPESGAIADYLLSRYGEGRFCPSADSEAFLDYLYWMHFGIATGMQPIMYKVRAPGHGLAGSSYDRAADDDLSRVLDHLDASLADGPYLLGDEFSAADIQVSFIPELANALGLLGSRDNIRRWLARLYARPAFERSLRIGAAYQFKVGI